MIVYFFSATPVLVAILVIALALLNGIADALNILTTISWIIVIVSSVSLVAYNMFRKASLGNKIAGTLISIAATVVSLFESRTFLVGITEMDTGGIIEMLGFAFSLFFGGSLWLCCVGLCCYASYHCFDEDYGDGMQYIGSTLAIIGSVVLASIFGLL